MPYTIKKSPKGGFDIIKSDTGKKVGHSSTRADAEASKRARLASEHGWKPTGKKKAKKKSKARQ